MKISARILAALAEGGRTFDELLAAIDIPKDDLNKMLQILRTKGEISFAGGRWSRGASGAPPAPAIAVSSPTPSPPPAVPAPAPFKPKEEPMAKTKHCSKCDTDKALGDFGNNASTSDGKQSWCRKCVSDYSKKARTPAGKKAPAAKRAKASAPASANGSGGILEGLRAHREKLQRSLSIVDQAIALLEADA